MKNSFDGLISRWDTMNLKMDQQKVSKLKHKHSQKNENKFKNRQKQSCRIMSDGLIYM